MLRDGVDLTQIEHILEYLTSSTCPIETLCDGLTAKTIQKHADFIQRVCGSSKVTLRAGFDHQALHASRLSKHTLAAALEALRVSIATHFDVLLQKIQPKLPIGLLGAGSVPVKKSTHAAAPTKKIKTIHSDNMLSSEGTSSLSGTQTKRPLFSTLYEEKQRAKKARMEATPPTPASAATPPPAPVPAVAPPPSTSSTHTTAPTRPSRPSSDLLSQLLSGDGGSPPPASNMSSDNAGGGLDKSRGAHRPLMTVPQRKAAVMLDRPPSGTTQPPQRDTGSAKVSVRECSRAGEGRGGGVLPLSTK